MEDEIVQAAYSAALHRHRVAARDRFMDDCKFLLSRDEILKRIRTLAIVSEWTEERVEDADWQAWLVLFMVPIRRCAVKVLSTATNTTKLLLPNFGTSVKMVARWRT